MKENRKNINSAYRKRNLRLSVLIKNITVTRTATDMRSQVLQASSYNNSVCNPEFYLILYIYFKVLWFHITSVC